MSLNEVANLTLGINIAFTWGWWEPSVGYAAYLAYQRNAVIDWNNAIGLPSGAPLPRINLNVIFADHKEDIGRGMRNALDLWQGTHDFTEDAADADYPRFQKAIGQSNAIIGTAWSDITKPVAAAGNALQTVQIGYASTSPDLSDKVKYPYFTRVCQSEDRLWYAAKHVLTTLNYTRVTFFYSAAEWANDLFKSTNALNQASPGELDIFALRLPYVSDKDVTSVPPSMSSAWNNAMSLALQTGNRVNVFFASSWDKEYEKILRFAHELGLAGPQFLWIAVTDNIQMDRLDNQILFPPAHGRTIVESYLGFLQINANKEGPRATELDEFYGSLNVDDFYDPVRKHLIAEGAWHFEDGTDYDMPRLFDAVSLFLIASIRLLRKGFAAEEIKSTVLLDELYRVSFPGAASMVELNKNGDAKSMFRVRNAQKVPNSKPLRFRMISVADGSDTMLTWLEPVIYPDGSSAPPAEAFVCPPGSSWNKNPATGQVVGCAQCDRGESGLGGTLPCLQCVNGSFSQSKGATSCVLSQPGSFVSGEGMVSERACPNGHYSTEAGQNACDICKPGTFAASGGSTGCTSCQAGSYGNLSGNSGCYSCPPMKTTRWEGAVSISACACVANMFLNHLTSQCEPCGEGVLCDLVVNDIPRILPGYSAVAVLDTDSFSGHRTYKCRSTRACPGGTAGSCPANSGGPTCADCFGDTFWDGTHCAECSMSGAMQFVSAFSLIVAVWIACVIAYIVCNSMAVSDVAFALNFSISLGLLVNVTMSFSVFSRFALDWQEPIASVIKFFGSLSMPIVFGEVQCFFNGNIVQSYLLISLLPVIAAIPMLLGFVMKCPAFKLVNTAGMCAYGCFTLMMLNGIKPFILYQHPNGESSIVTHPAVLVGLPVHNELVGVAIVQLLVYCLGYVAICCQACVRLGILQRQSLNEGTVQEMSRLLKWYGFLFIRFKPSHFWWGIVFLIRSTLVSLVPIIRPEEPYLQVLTLLLILTAFFVMHCVNLPFREPIENVADAATQGVLIIFIASGTLFLPKSGVSVKALGLGLSVSLFGVISVLAAVLFMPCVRLLKTGLQNQPSEDKKWQKRLEEADIVNELLEKQCGACVTLPLPSSLVAMEHSSKLHTDHARLHIVGDGQKQGSKGENVSAQVELSETALCIRFNSYTVAWKAQYVQEALRKESQLLNMMRCLMAAILDGVMTLHAVGDTGELVIKWCDPKLEDLLTCPVNSANVSSSNFGGFVSRPPIAGDKILNYICDNDKEKLLEYFHGLLLRMSDTKPQCFARIRQSVAMRNRGGDYFQCDMFAIPSMHRGEALLGLRVTNLLTGSSETSGTDLSSRPIEHFASFDLNDMVLHSCSPNWNVLFRQRMDGKPFLPHLVKPDDLQLVDGAIQKFTKFRTPQYLHELEFVQGSNSNRGTRFIATLILSSDEAKGPNLMQLALTKITWVPSDRRQCVQMKAKQLRRVNTQPGMLSLVSIKEQEPLSLPKSLSCLELNDTTLSTSPSAEIASPADLECSAPRQPTQEQIEKTKAKLKRLSSRDSDIVFGRCKSEPLPGGRGSHCLSPTRRSSTSSSSRSPRHSKRSSNSWPDFTLEVGEICNSSKVRHEATKESSGILGYPLCSSSADARVDLKGSTPTKTVQMGLLAMMFHINPDMRKRSSSSRCCDWHVVLHALAEASESLLKLEDGQCRKSWKRYTDWQCKVCKSFNSFIEDSAAAECEVCGEPRSAQSEKSRRVIVESTTKNVMVL